MFCVLNLFLKKCISPLNYLFEFLLGVFIMNSSMYNMGKYWFHLGLMNPGKTTMVETQNEQADNVECFVSRKRSFDKESIDNDNPCTTTDTKRLNVKRKSCLFKSTLQHVHIFLCKHLE